MWLRCFILIWDNLVHINILGWFINNKILVFSTSFDVYPLNQPPICRNRDRKIRKRENRFHVVEISLLLKIVGLVTLQEQKLEWENEKPSNKNAAVPLAETGRCFGGISFRNTYIMRLIMMYYHSASSDTEELLKVCRFWLYRVVPKSKCPSLGLLVTGSTIGIFGSLGASSRCLKLH